MNQDAAQEPQTCGDAAVFDTEQVTAEHLCHPGTGTRGTPGTLPGSQRDLLLLQGGESPPPRREAPLRQPPDNPPAPPSPQPVRTTVPIKQGLYARHRRTRSLFRRSLSVLPAPSSAVTAAPSCHLKSTAQTRSRASGWHRASLLKQNSK
ncbi:hypothetical protein GN956_G15745 [Arapaima gigas]